MTKHTLVSVNRALGGLMDPIIERVQGEARHAYVGTPVDVDALVKDLGTLLTHAQTMREAAAILTQAEDSIDILLGLSDPNAQVPGPVGGTC